jgi:hypothetical protein
VFFNAVGDNGFPQDSPTWSIADSRTKNVFVCTVKPNPETFIFRGHSISFGDAWIERQVKTHYFLAWIPFHSLRPGYFLCFRLKEGGDFLAPRYLENYHPFFVMNGAHKSFSSVGKVLFYDEIAQATFASGSVRFSLINSFDDPRPDNFSFRW